MQTATNIFSRFVFKRGFTTKNIQQILVFFDGYCVQNYMLLKMADGSWDKIDHSQHSPFIGLTARHIETRFITRFELYQWEGAILFFEDEPDPHCWLAGRLQFFKELTADRHISSKLIRKLTGAK